MNESERYLQEQLITYIGNKRKLLGFIGVGINHVIKRLNKPKLDILDGFSGSGIVARYFKQFSNKLYVNDMEYYSYIVNSCYLSNIKDTNIIEIHNIIDELNANKMSKEYDPGIIERLYAPRDDKKIIKNERVFYTNQNARIIDNIRRDIDNISNQNIGFYLAPLLSEASIHANTSGVFKGFYKNSKTKKGQFGGNAKNCLSRIMGEISIPYPILSNFECDYKIYQKDINKLIKKIPKMDVAYYDPPYNQHPYGSNYFMLNIIAKYEEPMDISKISGIPKNWNKSLYNKKRTVLGAFEELIANTPSKFILISYNNEGFVSYNEFKEMAKKYGKVGVKKQKYNTFRASRNLYKRSKTVNELLVIIERK